MSNDDDEWSFSSALPAEPAAPKAPKEHTIIVKDGPLRIDMKAVRPPQAQQAIGLAFAFSNTTPAPVDDIHFQLAVTKVCTLHCARLNADFGMLISINV